MLCVTYVFEDIIQHQLRMDGFHALNQHLPNPLNSLLKKPSDVHQHFTRIAGISIKSKQQYKSSIITATATSFNNFAKEVDPSGLMESTFRRKSRNQILMSYEGFRCNDGRCYICNELRDLHVAMPHLKN